MMDAVAQVAAGPSGRLRVPEGLACLIKTANQLLSNHKTPHHSRELTEKTMQRQTEKNNTTFSKHVWLKISSRRADTPGIIAG